MRNLLEEQGIVTPPATVATSQGKSINAQPGPTWADLGKSGVTGVRLGAEQAVGTYGDIPSAAGGLAGWIANKFGVPPETAQQLADQVEHGARFITDPKAKIAKVAELLGFRQPGGEQPHIMPTTPDVMAGTDWAVKQLPEAVSGPVQDITRHPATTPEERFMQSSGQFAGTSFLPGGALAKVARPFVTAGGVELAGEMAPKGYEDAARLVAGVLLGGGIAKGEQSFRTRSAFRTVGTTPEATQRVVQLLRDSGMSPEEAAAKVDQHPLLRAYNVSPNLQQEAQQIYAEGGRARGFMKPILEEQQKAVNPQLEQDVTQAVGPYSERAPILAALDQRASEAAARREATHPQQAQPADTNFILTQIEDDLATVKDPAMRSKLQRVKNALAVPGATLQGQPIHVLDQSSKGVAAARDAISNMLYDNNGKVRSNLGGKEVALLKKYYAEVNKAMDTANPAFRAEDVNIAAANRQQEAFQKGEQVFDKGREAQGPVSFAQEYSGLPQTEKEALVQGIGAETWRRLGQEGNDLVALKKMLVGEGKIPVDKLTTAIGPEKTQQLLDALEHAGTIQQGSRKVLEGSKTAETLRGKGPPSAVQAAVDAAPEVIASTLFSPAAGAVSATNKLKTFIQQRLATGVTPELNAEVAKLLMTNRGDDLVRAARALQQAKGRPIAADAALSALLSRQQDLASRKESQR